jgi:eukaryotic-like serine/threonine-protein kinase
MTQTASLESRQDRLPEPAGFRPTVFIGLGGAASRVLRQLRQRFTQRFGDAGLLPSLRFLAVDTDSSALRAIEAGRDAAGLDADEMLHLPLRKTSEYRAATDDLLVWLSRRWLYNIPRSLQTEGLRPLGRLAFIDHRVAIAERLRAVLTEAVSEPSCERTSQAMRLAARSTTPRVFVITSIGGGAGSGMLLDVAYAVRQQLDELGLAGDGLCCAMLHATFAGSPGNDLRKANAYATLTELNHFMQGGAAYRTGPMEVLPAGDVSEPPFRDAYLIELGDELADAAFDAGLRRVADYLYLDAATAGGAALDGFRQAATAPPSSLHAPARLRSFGLHAIRFDKHGIAACQADHLSLRLVRNWLGESEDNLPPTARVQPPDFTLDDLAQRVQAIANKAMGGSAEAHFRTLVAADGGRPALVSDDDPAGPFGDELRRIHAVLGLPSVLAAAQSVALSRFESMLRDGCQKLAADMRSSLVASIEALVERPQACVPTATAAANLFQEHLRDLRQAADEIFRRDQGEATALWSKLQRGELPRQRASWFGRFSAAAIDPEECLLEYCRMRLRATVHHYLGAILQEISGGIAGLNDRLIKLRQSTQWLASELAAVVADPLPAAHADDLAPAIDIDRFAASVRRLLQSAGGLLSLADQGPDQWRERLNQMRDCARDHVLTSLSGIDAGHLLVKHHPTPEKLGRAIATAIEMAAPRPNAAADRLLVAVPGGPSAAAIAAALGEASPGVTILLTSDDSDLVFCREAEDISLIMAAAAIIEDRGDCAEAARRVLTRLDVPWTSLQQDTGGLVAVPAVPISFPS